jgi:hypothetical protein
VDSIFLAKLSIAILRDFRDGIGRRIQHGSSLLNVESGRRETPMIDGTVIRSCSTRSWLPRDGRSPFWTSYQESSGSGIGPRDPRVALAPGHMAVTSRSINQVSFHHSLSLTHPPPQRRECSKHCLVSGGSQWGAIVAPGQILTDSRAPSASRIQSPYTSTATEA